MRLDNEARSTTTRSEMRPMAMPFARLASLITVPKMSERTVVLADGPIRLSLETTMWEGLDEAARRQRRPVDTLCDELDAERPPQVELATAIRTFVLRYYRELASI